MPQLTQAAPPDAPTWNIPVCLRYGTGTTPSAPSQRQCFVLTERTATVPCDRDRDEACGFRQVDERVRVHGFAASVGVTAQLTLGARRGGRFVVWADLGTQLARFQFADAVVAGRLTQLTIGIGHAHAF